MDQIVTADMHFGVPMALRHAALLSILRARGIDPDSIGGHDAPTGTAIVAVVNHGRWVVPCPWCNGAELGTPGDPFLCSNCLNGGSRRYAPVTYPNDAETIESALVVRPVHETRNWRAPETIEILLNENARHGVGG